MLEIKNLDNLELNKIQKYGFIIKPFLLWKQYFNTLFSHLSYFGILLWMLFITLNILFLYLQQMFGWSIEIYSIIDEILTYIFCGSYIWLFIFITYKFSLFQKILFTKKWVVINNNSYDSSKLVPLWILSEWLKVNSVWKEILSSLIWIPSLTKYRSLKEYWYVIMFWLFAWILIGFFILFSVGYFLFWSLLIIIFQHIFPLTRFIKLWERIQSLTPEIEKESWVIRDNFQKDMNFRVLSDGFDALANTFSQIVALVIKLEKIEKRANKWNLFDSEKYINSLREDIVEPLKSLRSFLEKHKKELIQSQKDLQKVRVGWDPESSSGWQEHTELASKRWESLIVELDENIGRLDVMVAKMQ